MKRTELHALIKECLQEVLEEGRRICAWCHPDSPTRDMGVAVTPEDSHGMCKPCADKMKKDIEKVKPHQPTSHTGPTPPVNEGSAKKIVNPHAVPGLSGAKEHEKQMYKDLRQSGDSHGEALTTIKGERNMASYAASRGK